MSLPLKFLLTNLLLLFACLFAEAGQRSAAAISEFKRHNPCPANGERRGSCPGYVIDHMVPLCAGGPDTSANMQWQTRADSLVKDIAERRQCRALKRDVRPRTE